MATNEGKPMGQLMVAEDEVRPFMNPLPIIRLPGIGPSTFQTLTRIGIRKIETLAEIPNDVMQKLLGKFGLSIAQKAKGIDFTPVKPYTKRKSISKERTFQQDTIDKKMLHTILAGMVEDLCFQMRSEKTLTSSISVKIKYTNFDTHTKQMSIPHTACDITLRKAAYQLLHNVYQRRMRIRLLGVSFSKLVNGLYQINMFDDTPQKIKLYQAMDGIKNRFNEGVIQWGTGFKPKTEERDRLAVVRAVRSAGNNYNEGAKPFNFKSSAHLYESVGGDHKYRGKN